MKKWVENKVYIVFGKYYLLWSGIIVGMVIGITFYSVVDDTPDGVENWISSIGTLLAIIVSLSISNKARIDNNNKNDIKILDESSDDLNMIIRICYDYLLPMDVQLNCFEYSDKDLKENLDGELQFITNECTVTDEQLKFVTEKYNIFIKDMNEFNGIWMDAIRRIDISKERIHEKSLYTAIGNFVLLAKLNNNSVCTILHDMRINEDSVYDKINNLKSIKGLISETINSVQDIIDARKQFHLEFRNNV